MPRSVFAEYSEIEETECWHNGLISIPELCAADLILARDLDEDNDILVFGSRFLIHIEEHGHPMEQTACVLYGVRGKRCLNWFRELVASVRGPLTQGDRMILEAGRPLESYLSELWEKLDAEEELLNETWCGDAPTRDHQPECEC